MRLLYLILSDLEIEKLRALHGNIAGRLEDIVNNLQINLLPYASALPASDSVLLALAELKQIKDVMSGNLPLEAFHPH